MTTLFDRLRSDMLSAIRGVKAALAPSIAAMVLLAVAVGINLGMFGLIDRALLSPPPQIANPEEVVTLAFQRKGDTPTQGRMTTTSHVTFERIQSGVPSLDDVAAWRQTSTGVVIAGEQVQADVVMVSQGYFRLLRARPSIGPGILPEDEAAPLAVLSNGFWRSTFGGDPAVVGRRIVVDGVEFAISGVMPAGFSGHSASRVDLWLALGPAMSGEPGWDRDAYRLVVSILGRLKPGETAVAAAAQASSATDLQVSAAPILGAGVSTRDKSIALWLTAISVLVLIMGLANTATLLLVRGARRRRDAAIRVSLGATRGRLLLQLLLEAIVLAVCATGAAIVSSFWFDEVVRRLLLPTVSETSGLPPRTMLVAALSGLAATVVAVAIGIIQLPSGVRAHDLDRAGRGRRARAQTVLLLMQTTVTVALIAGAVMFARSLYNLGAQDFGLDMDGVWIVDFDRGPGVIAEQDEIFASALEGIRTLPGVQAVTPVQSLPFGGRHVPPISVPGFDEPPNVNGQLPFLLAATPEFLDILRIEVVQGRRFAPSDENGAPVAIVNETMARSVWPGESAIGKCFRIGLDPSFDPALDAGPPRPPASAPCRRIVGVARDVRQRSVFPVGHEDRLMQYFIPFSQLPPQPAWMHAGPQIHTLLLRSDAPAAALVGPIRRLMTGGRTDLPFVRVRPYSHLLENQIRPWRLGSALLSLFSALALVVAAIGLYAAFAQAATERQREMAIRLAIGAEPRGLRRMMLREALRLAAVGVIGGFVLAVIGGRWMQSMLFGTAPTDPIVLGSAALILMMATALATYLPARTASQADPMSLLRTE